MEAGPLLSTSERFLALSFLIKEVILLRVLRVLEFFLGFTPGSSSQVQELRMLMSYRAPSWSSTLAGFVLISLPRSDLGSDLSDGLLRLLLDVLSLSLLQELVLRLEEALGDKL